MGACPRVRGFVFFLLVEANSLVGTEVGFDAVCLGEGRSTILGARGGRSKRIRGPI